MNLGVGRLLDIFANRTQDLGINYPVCTMAALPLIAPDEISFQLFSIQAEGE